MKLCGERGKGIRRIKMSYDLDDIIEHYGVKGMKWGVRKKPEKKRLIVGLTENSRNKDRRPSYIAPGLGGMAIHLAARHAENKKLNKAISTSMNTPIKDIDKKSLKTAREAMKNYTDLRMAFEGEDKEYNIVEHYGVKGMKWGVRKKVGKAVEKTTIAVGKQIKKRRDKQDAYHDKRMKSSKAYKLVYEGTLPTVSRGRDRKRQKAARATYRSLQINLASMVVGGALAAASSKNGRKAIKTVSNFVVSGQAQKIGKNVLNTVMGNPLRYVNAENMKNIVVDSGALGGG